jgi:adenosylcobinamide kinase/adenosylcobinamide-phosphate guanylyltransferase
LGENSLSKLTLILGGARSGKSSYAQQLALKYGGRVLYIATSQALDEEMSARIAVHRSERPHDWKTIEAPTQIAAALQNRPEADIILLDCITLLVSNLLLKDGSREGEPDEEVCSQRVETEIQEILFSARSLPADWIIVSNEVGLGVVPPYPLGRVYRDLLGRANQRLAAAADEVYFMISGIPVPIHSFRIG